MVGRVEGVLGISCRGVLLYHGRMEEGDAGGHCIHERHRDGRVGRRGERAVRGRGQRVGRRTQRGEGGTGVGRIRVVVRRSDAERGVARVIRRGC